VSFEPDEEKLGELVKNRGREDRFSNPMIFALSLDRSYYGDRLCLWNSTPFSSDGFRRSSSIFQGLDIVLPSKIRKGVDLKRRYSAIENQVADPVSERFSNLGENATNRNIEVHHWSKASSDFTVIADAY